LQNRGLEPHVIEQALELTYSSDDEFQQCLTLAERWWIQESKRWEQRVQDQDQEKDAKNALPRQLLLQQKVARKLVQRGYPSDMVRNVLYQIQTNSNDNMQ